MESLLYSDSLVRLLGEDSVHALRCSICLDLFDNPIILFCGHTFCLACMQHTANYVLDQNPQQLPWKVYVNCPECRRPMNAHKVVKGFNLSSNYPIASLLETMKKVMIPLKMDASTNTEDPPIMVDVGTQAYDLQQKQREDAIKLDRKQIDEIEQRVSELCILNRAHIVKLRQDNRFTSLSCPNDVYDQLCEGKTSDEPIVKHVRNVHVTGDTQTPRASVSSVAISTLDTKIKELIKFIDDTEIMTRQKQTSKNKKKKKKKGKTNH